MNILAHESRSRILYAWRSDPESREIRLPREFKVWPRMPGDCRKVNPPVESCLNGKVVILRRHAQTDVHPVEFVLRQSLPCDSISWAASPTRVIVLQSSRRSAAPPIATPSSRNPVSPRPRFPTELRILGKPSTSRRHSLASVARFRAITQLFRDVLAKNGPITLCISVA